MVYVKFLVVRHSHQAPRCIMVPVLLLVGIVRVHYLYLNPKICKYQIFSTDILYSNHLLSLFWREQNSYFLVGTYSNSM